MSRTALIVGLLLASSPSRAQTETTGTMCGKFFTTALGCSDTTGVYVEPSQFDDTLSVWTASSNVRTKLLVFFHGHGGTPRGSTDFLQLAAGEGYDVVSLDFDYGRDYPSACYTPGDAICANPETDSHGNLVCNMGLDQVCGCYTDCYGYRWRSIWQGGSCTGLPTVNSDWTIDQRLYRVIKYMGNNVNSRWNNYLDSSQHAGINWKGKLVNGVTKGGVTTAGHSLGASLAAYIAKWVKVDRVIMMSGAGDKMAPDSGSPFTAWGKAYGASSCAGVDHNGNPLTFTNCDYHHNTAFAYGVANGIGNCTLSTAAVGWVLDNNFLNGSGTHNGGVDWATSNSHFYGFEDSNDGTCNWEAPNPATMSSHRNWSAISLDLQHDSGYSDGWNQINGSGATTVDTFSPAHYHGVLVTTASGGDAQICDAGGVSGHNATISDDACGNNLFDLINRTDAWDFMLTN